MPDDSTLIRDPGTQTSVRLIISYSMKWYMVFAISSDTSTNTVVWTTGNYYWICEAGFELSPFSHTALSVGSCSVHVDGRWEKTFFACKREKTFFACWWEETFFACINNPEKWAPQSPLQALAYWISGLGAANVRGYETHKAKKISERPSQSWEGRRANLDSRCPVVWSWHEIRCAVTHNHAWAWRNVAQI
jgi:hypothetical protein